MGIRADFACLDLACWQPLSFAITSSAVTTLANSLCSLAKVASWISSAVHCFPEIADPIFSNLSSDYLRLFLTEDFGIAIYSEDR
jgi:hypothetical protein